jgi:hypothetical protein
MRAGVAIALMMLAPALVAAQAPAPSARDAQALAIAADVHGQGIYDGIAALTENPQTGYRLVGTQTHDNARAWIEGQFTAMGLQPKEFAHNCSGPNGAVIGDDVVEPLPNGQNVPQPAKSVLALVPGRNVSEWAVIGGHYDGQETTVGALDNAAGVNSVLEIGRGFAKHQAELDASVLLVAWDCEEWGVWGSYEFMRHLPEVEQLMGIPPGSLHLRMAVSLDMPGLNWPAKDTFPTYHKGAFSVLHARTSPIDTFGFKSSYGEYNKSNYTAAQLQGFQQYRLMTEHAAYDLLGLPRQWVWVEDDTFGRTDHVPFVAHGIPGMRVHGPNDEEYPPYHDPADTLPVLENAAGGKDLLVKGFETAARFTTVTAALMALPGTYDANATAQGAGGAARTPDVGFTMVTFAVAAAALLVARRRNGP